MLSQDYKRNEVQNFAFLSPTTQTVKVTLIYAGSNGSPEYSWSVTGNTAYSIKSLATANSITEAQVDACVGFLIVNDNDELYWNLSSNNAGTPATTPSGAWKYPAGEMIGVGMVP